MGPDEPKGEMPPRVAAEQEKKVRKQVEREGTPREGAPASIDEREEDGFSQPESSAQKGPSSPEPEEP